ncbi:S-4TM family putative pore-forming effector [Streptomyces sp. NPDC127068]|uniref:S-4TM family putative pore-forming effector n=1 Tax=Streptomyces sp. NPDC127068 TaxID=3347127 RepID=UPI003650087F
MGSSASSGIGRRQNESGALRLLRAADVSHRRAQRIEAWHRTVSFLLAAGALVTLAVPAAGTTVSLAGLVWALLYAAWASQWAGNEFHRAAVLQELFDTEMFGLPWNPLVAGAPPSAQEISRLSRSFRGSDDRLRDYYEIGDLPSPWDVFACQLQNLGWGSRIRRRYATVVAWVLVLWCAGGVGVGIVRDMSITSVLTDWFVPSLGLLLLGVDVYRSQRDTVTAREHAYALLREQVERHAAAGAPAAELPALLAWARQVQDVLLHTRLGQARVPNWFFRRFLEADRADFAADLADLRRRAAAGGAEE